MANIEKALRNHKRRLIRAEKSIQKENGVAIWTDIKTPAITDDFGNIITSEVKDDFKIYLLPTKVENGWISSGIANADNKVFLVPAKTLLDYGITFDKTETITYNGNSYKIERDEPDVDGIGVITHSFICSVTT